MEFSIGQHYSGVYPPEAAMWCNINGAMITKVENGYEIVAIPESEDQNNIRIAEIEAELSDLDNQSVRPLRAILSNNGTEEDKEKLASIEKQVEELRTELKTLENEEE